MKRKNSKLQKNPRSKVTIPGYINIYSELNEKEKRQHYFKTKYKEGNPMWDETLVFLSREFKHKVKKNSIVLDVGCGNGNFVVDENRGDISWAVGIDVEKKYVKKNICLDEIKIGYVEELPFEDNTFDVVISLWVLEHLENPLQTFTEIHRVLKPGGIFMFAAPNIYFFPLFIINVLKSSKINHLLNEKLYGRKEKDVFEAYYKANSIKRIEKLSANLFKLDTLKLNYDPSYTSINEFTFSASNTFQKLISIYSASLIYPHIVGLLTKEK